MESAPVPNTTSPADTDLNASFDNDGTNNEQVAFRAARNLIPYCLQDMLSPKVLAAGELAANGPGLTGETSASAGAFHALQPVLLQCPQADCDAAKCCCRYSCA